MKGYFIVKVQTSIETTHDTQQVLVYDEHRTFQHECALGPDVRALMKGRLKVYFWACWSGSKLILSTEAPVQNW